MFADDSVAPCRWTVSHVPPGTYVALLRNAQGLGGSQVFGVTAQQTADVVIPGPTVRVSGRVLYDGRPLAGAAVSLVRKPSPTSATPLVFATTGVDGRYALILDWPGEYSVGVSVGDLTPRSLSEGSYSRFGATISLDTGSNTIDIARDGAGITVRLNGWDGTTSTTVVFRSTTSAKSNTLKAGDVNPFRKIQLEDGEYRILAYQDKALVSRAMQTVTIDHDHPEAAVDLDLVNSQSTLTLRDPDGHLVSGASATGWTGRNEFPQLLEIAPGVFSLVGIAPGTELRIQPPAAWMPVCRVSPLNQAVDVVLARGRAAEVVFERRGVEGPVGTLSGVEGSDCPVPLPLFQSARIGLTGEAPRFTIRNFPLSHDLAFEFQGLLLQVDVPSSGPVVIK